MNILLHFYDDSTLFIALKIYNNFIHCKNCNIIFLHIYDKNKLSERQLTILNESYVVLKVNLKCFYDAQLLSNFDLVIYSKLPCGIFDKNKLRNTDKYFVNMRPYFLSMISGIDFTPEKGIKNRCNADGICITNNNIRHKYKDIIGSRQNIYKYHPFFCIKKDVKLPQQIKNIYFFAQSVIPNTLSERINIILIIIEISKKNPQKNIFIKLRHLKGENQSHTHKEIFSYEDILKICSKHDEIPTNL